MVDLVNLLHVVVTLNVNTLKRLRMVNNMNKIIGFYGGKFMPLHKGHLFCIDKMSHDCDIAVIIMFINGLKIRQISKNQLIQNIIILLKII